MTTMTYAQAIREGLDGAMGADDNVFLIGEDIGEAGGVFGVTKGLWDKYKDRVFDTPISEEALVGAAAGAALLGGRPIAEIMFSDFSTLAMDMLVNQAAKTSYMTGGRLSCPITVRMVTGTAGATAAQHSQSLEAWFTHTPGLKCVAPSTPADAKALIKTAIGDPDPVMFFEHKMLYNMKGEVPAESDVLPLGKGTVVRDGTDVTIVSYLKTLHESVKAAEQLDKDGISAEIFDPRSLMPFDREGFGASLERTGRLVIAHEAPATNGFGAEIAAIASEDFWSLLRGPIVRVCGRDTPVPYAPELEGFVLPDAQRITDTVHQMMKQEVATRA